MDFFWVVKLPRVHDVHWIIFFFLKPVQWHCMILMDSSSLSSPFLFVTSTYNILLRTLSSSCGAICFKIFSRWRECTRMTFAHSLFCGAVPILTMFIHSDRVELLYCFVWIYRKRGNIYHFEMATNLLLCGFRLFAFCWTRYHTHLKQMLKKNRQNIRQNGHWKLETSLKVDLQPEGAHNRYSKTVIN